VRNGFGDAVELWHLDRRRVRPDRFEGRLVYEVENGSGVRNTVLLPEQVYHLKGLSGDGLVGWGVVEMARRSIRLGLQEEQFGTSTFGKGPMPGGVMELPGNPTLEAKEKLRKDIERLYGGSANAGKVLVLSGGQKFTKLDLSNSDAQFLESRKFQVTDICRWFGVPPHKLADLDRATFSNIEEQEIAFVVDCLFAWARRLEQEADGKLVPPPLRGRRFTKLNLAARLRGNSQTQTNTVMAKVQGGVLTVNEARAYFDMRAIPGGDTPLVQGAMVPLERVLEEPAPPPPAPPAPEPEEPADREGVVRVFGGLLEGVFARLLRVEADKAKRAANKGELEQHAEAFYGEHAVAHAAAALTPVLQGLAFALRRPQAEAAEQAKLAAAAHVARSRADLSEHGPAALRRWEKKRPGEDAEALIQGVLAWSPAG
jgi:HK97 family phage portal protein